MMNDEWQDWPATVTCNYPDCDGGYATGYCHNDCRNHPLDVPDYLRIPQEARREAWVRFNPVSATGATTSGEDKGPGSTCRKAGIPDGINQNLVERMEMLEAAKQAKSKALLYEMDERRKQEKAERASVKEAVQKQHKAKRRRRSF